MSISCPVLAVSVGLPRAVTHRGKPARTGIYKSPVAGAVEAGPLGLEGDGQADLVNHGGPDKALLAYSFAHLLDWRRELGREDIGPASFGENLTLRSIDEREVHIGDVFRCGGARLQVTQPREPCWKLAMKLETPTLPKRVLASGRTGFYLRVLEPGAIEAGDDFVRIESDPVGMSVHDVHRIMHFERDDLAGVRRALSVAALSAAWREPLQARLSSRAPS